MLSERQARLPAEWLALAEREAALQARVAPSARGDVAAVVAPGEKGNSKNEAEASVRVATVEHLMGSAPEVCARDGHGFTVPCVVAADVPRHLEDGDSASEAPSSEQRVESDQEPPELLSSDMKVAPLGSLVGAGRRLAFGVWRKRSRGCRQRRRRRWRRRRRRRRKLVAGTSLSSF